MFGKCHVFFVQIWAGNPRGQGPYGPGNPGAKDHMGQGTKGPCTKLGPAWPLGSRRIVLQEHDIFQESWISLKIDFSCLNYLCYVGQS